MHTKPKLLILITLMLGIWFTALVYHIGYKAGQESMSPKLTAVFTVADNPQFTNSVTVQVPMQARRLDGVANLTSNRLFINYRGKEEAK